MPREERLYRDYPFAELRASDGSARIRLYTLGYEFPAVTTGDDAAWHMNYVSLRVNGVSAQISEPLIAAGELARCLEELAVFRERQASEVDSSFTEQGFGFTLSNEPLSEEKVTVSGWMLNSVLDSRATVHFEFKTNLRLLGVFAAGVALTLEKFPPRF